jgi:hypothetical protein
MICQSWQSMVGLTPKGIGKDFRPSGIFLGIYDRYESIVPAFVQGKCGLGRSLNWKGVRYMEPDP